MKPEDVPEELLDLAWRAELARRSPTASAELIEECCDFEIHPALRSQRDDLRPVLAAVLPAHERQVRERLAAEVVRAFSPLEPTDNYDKGVLDAATVVRPGTPEGQRPLTREEIIAALDQPKEPS